MKGYSHVMNQEIRIITDIFAELGFVVANGPELETEFYNFDALNIPADHPARDMQDTFWVKGEEKRLLRTHTSNVQIRFMQANTPPFGMLAPGKVYRNEATDATHEAQFHQVEGMYINKKVSMKDLKGTLEYFFKKSKVLQFYIRVFYCCLSIISIYFLRRLNIIFLFRCTQTVNLGMIVFYQNSKSN
jgi:phenylalanyl-tRNA synthetase alpha chain